MNHKKLFYSGTSNVVLPVPNKLAFPPAFQDKTRLTYYASLFNTVEINSSFYKMPRGVTISKWADSVPETFRFTFKLWQNITHNKELNFNPADVDQFMQAIMQAGDKKGCLLVQFPPGLTVNPYRLETLLTCIRQADPDREWKVAVEFRNRTWYRRDIYDLISQYRMAMVIHDLPASATPLLASQPDFIYLRFHGPESGYRGSYTDDYLSEYAGYITDWLSEGKTVYVYFNNTLGNAVQNLITLNRFVNQ